MKWKDPHLEKEFLELAPHFQDAAFMFEGLSRAYGVEPVVTRVYDPVGCIAVGDHKVCESGVHPAKRAIDFRDSHGGKHLYSEEQKEELLDRMNSLYQRMDGKMTLIHHSFAGGEPHFHLQWPSDERVLKLG
jgi:hypothetical protein